MCKLKKKDEEMLELLVSHDVVDVALELGYADPNALYQRLHRLRQKRIDAQTCVNKLNAYSNRSPRLRKFLTSGKIKDLEKR